MKTIDEQVTDALRQLESAQANLTRLQAEKDALTRLGDVGVIAELLHTTLCKDDKDDCGWYHESWSQPGIIRKRYLDRAATILRECAMCAQRATRIIHAMEGLI